MSDVELSELEKDVLQAAVDERVTWRRQSFRMWGNSDPDDSDDTYVLVTKAAKRLYHHGMILKEISPGYKHVEFGFCVATPKGREALT